MAAIDVTGQTRTKAVASRRERVVAVTRTVAIVAMRGVQLLDISGPLDVFAEANVQAGRAAYPLLVVASGPPGDIRSFSGARLPANHVIGGQR
jgi:transcriptional regulator GlxA family with amidase domain